MAYPNRVNASVVLIVVSIVLFVLAAFKVHIDRFTAINLAEFGLATFAGAHLV